MAGLEDLFSAYSKNKSVEDLANALAQSGAFTDNSIQSNDEYLARARDLQNKKAEMLAQSQNVDMPLIMSAFARGVGALAQKQDPTQAVFSEAQNLQNQRRQRVLDEIGKNEFELSALAQRQKLMQDQSKQKMDLAKELLGTRMKESSEAAKDLRQQRALAEQLKRETLRAESKESIAATKNQPKTQEDILAKLPTEGKKALNFIGSALANIDKYEEAVNKGGEQSYFTPQTPAIGKFISSTPIDESRLALEEAIGRMASGGAISKNEEDRFRAMIPTAADFRNPEIVKRKINALKSEFESRANAFGIGREGMVKMGLIPSLGGAAPSTGYGKDVLDYAKSHGITPDQANKIKLSRTGG